MIPLPPDPWNILGVEKTADKSEIRTAYRKLVLKCHPDKVQDPTLKAEKQEEFQKVQQAYELLNDDAERTKYEEQVQLMELRKQAALLSKNIANSSSPRSTTKTYTYEIRTAEIRTAEPPKSKSSGGAKVYEHFASPHTRSHEEVTSKAYAAYEEIEKQARRTASYEKPSKRDEERREKEERRRRKDEEERIRDREREQREKERELREKERELREREKEKERKAEKKKQRELEEKERDRQRRRDRKSPYVEDYGTPEEEVYASSRLDKKRSSSRKHSEYREREKSMSRREREATPIEIVEPSSKTKDQTLKETAADYIARSRGNAAAPSPIFQRAQQEAFYTPPVPTPPPADPEEESIRRSAARAAGRRSSHETPKERVLHKQSSRDAYVVVDATPSKARPIPGLSKAHSTPPVVPESPPRVSRSNTVPMPEYVRHLAQPPSFSRTQTWGGVEDRHYDDYESDEDRREHERRHRRNSRRTRSPEPSHSYRTYEVVDRTRSSKHDHYSYGESPTSSRRYPSEIIEPSGGSYPSTINFTRVKESKAYGPEDVTYAQHQYAYKPSSGDYSTSVYA